MDEEDLNTFEEAIKSQLPMFRSEGKLEHVAIAFLGQKRTSFKGIQELADAIIKGAEEVIESEYPLIVVVENDIGKVLGNCAQCKAASREAGHLYRSDPHIERRLSHIGEPLVGGQVLPVVNKTLVFNT
mgnify:CR=1 FL=1